MGNCHHRKAYSSHDFIIKCPVEEITRQFFSDYIVVWHAINVDSPQNKQVRSQLEKFCEAKTFTEWEQTSAFLLKAKKKCYVITSGENGEMLVKKICCVENVLGIYIYCKNKDFHFQWAQKYPKTASVEKSTADVVKQISEKLLKWFQTQDFEDRFPLFLDVNQAEMSALKIAVHFKNRVEAKNDLLSLARTIYSDDQCNFDETEGNILKDWWSDKQSFLYKIVNSCLRIGTLDALDYCRLILKDMEQAIFEERNENFKDGLVVYKGIEVAQEGEWLKWKKNLDKEIEAQGFFTASRRKETALEFINKDESKRVLVTIIMPKGPNDEQGFVLKKDEVLFNLRSRFTVLEIEDLPSKRHVVLVYGAQGFGRFMSEKNPIQEILVPKGKISCVMCQDEFCHEKMFYCSLRNSQYCCQKCRIKFLKKDSGNGPLLCIPATENGYKARLKGILVSYTADFRVPFYGYKCSQCETKRSEKSYYYKCIECCKVWCGDCAESVSGCLEAKHNIILESRPFSFWCEKMVKALQKEVIGEAFQQAENHFNKSENEKAMQYYKLYLRQNNEKKANDTNFATACFQIGVIYDTKKNYQRALEYFYKALEIRKSLYGENHNEVANTYNKIGLCHWGKGEHQKALEFCSKALNIWKSTNGEKSLVAASAYNSLGLASNGEKQHIKALEFYSKAIEIRKGEKNSSLAVYYSNMGWTFEVQKDDAKALEYYTKALEIRKLVHGENHADVANSYDDLGRVSSRQALEYCWKALEIRKAIYGENHADVAKSYYNIGKAYYKREKYSKALENHLKALETRKFLYGEDHDEIASCCNSIGLVYDKQREWSLALEYFSQALEIGLLIHGKKNVDVAIYCSNIGGVYYDQENYVKALEYYRKALEIRKSIFGEIHWSVAQLYHNIGISTFWKESHDPHLRGLEINEEVYGENSSQVATSCDYAGTAYFNQSDWKKTIAYYLRALKIREGILPENDVEIASSCKKLGTAYFYQAENKKALDYCSRALAIRKIVFGESHNKTVKVEDLMIRIRKADGRNKS